MARAQVRSCRHRDLKLRRGRTRVVNVCLDCVRPKQVGEHEDKTSVHPMRID